MSSVFNAVVLVWGESTLGLNAEIVEDTIALGLGIIIIDRTIMPETTIHPLADTGKSLILPIVSPEVRAGFPSPADDHLETPLDLNEKLIANPAATFLVKVAGVPYPALTSCPMIFSSLTKAMRLMTVKLSSPWSMVSLPSNDFTINPVKLFWSRRMMHTRPPPSKKVMKCIFGA